MTGDGRLKIKNALVSVSDKTGLEKLVTYLDKSFKDNCPDRVKQLLGFNYEYPKLMDTSKSVNDIGIGYKGKN